MSYPVSTSNHLCFDMNYQIPCKEQALRIIRNGFEHLDFNFLDWHGDSRSPFLSDHWLDWVKEVGEAVTGAGADFNQAHAPTTGFGDFSMKDLQLRAIEGCGALSIPWMVFHIVGHEVTDDSVYGMNIEYFRSLLDTAHKYNVGIAIENIWPIQEYSPLSRTENLIRLVDMIDDPLIGICWDTGHGNLIGRRPSDQPERETSLDASGDPYRQLTAVGKRLKALHINDNDGLGNNHIEPFEGCIDWNRVMRALKDIGYEHSFTFEANFSCRRLPEELVDRKIRLLHDIGETMVLWDEEHPFSNTIS